MGLPRTAIFCGAVLVAAAARAGAARAAACGDECWKTVAVEGRELPASFRVAVHRLGLLRVRGGQAESIPFQVDERDAAGQFALPSGPFASVDEKPFVLDENDLLVFGARDLGEEAEVPGAAEIHVRDPVTGAAGYAYLVVDGSLPAATRDEVGYDAASDTVRARRYVLAFGKHTASAFAFVGPDGKPGPNVLDRLKARVKARILWGWLEFRRTEEDLRSEVLAWKDGPVRVIRRVRLRIGVGFGLPDPEIVAEDFFTADAFEGPVLVRLPFDLRYVFGDLTVRIYLDFQSFDGYRLFADGRAPERVDCGGGSVPLDGVPSDWFGMSGPEGTFVQALRVSSELQSVRRTLYAVADRERDDVPESVRGTCPAVGYTLSHWAGVGRGTHHVDMVIRAFDRYDPHSIETFLASLGQPLSVQVSWPLPGRATAKEGGR